ncbi:MAG TPA: oligosaccharide flippase family protein [Kofleriaceae bacterium]|nr:oligosaccharide flippase family protein [Kofleriaceae bacterium]
MGNDDRKLGRGTAWVGIASGLSGTLDLITTATCLWLWLSPADLGIATLAGALLPVLERLAGLGMPAALVRQGDGDRRALSTMLWIGVAGSCVVLAAVIGLGPVIGHAFGAPIIGSLLIGYGVKLVLQNVHVVPEALLRRELAFGRLTRVRIAASFGDAIAKLVAAYLGAHGYPELRIWCFAIGPLASGVITSIGIQLCRPWRPALAFDRAAAAGALRYGSQVAGGELLYFVYTNADYLVVGAVWDKAAVGAYRLAYELVLDVVRLISLVTAEVAFPAFARLASHRDRAGELMIRFTRQNAIALVPVVVFLAVEAGDLLAVLYPPLGPAATTAARILCVVGGLRMLSFVLPAMLAGMGHAADALIYHLFASVVLPVGFVLAARIAPDAGYVAVAWGWAASYPVAFAVLLQRALARGRVSLASYLRSLGGVMLCGAGAAAGAIAVHAALPGPAVVRLFAIAAVIVAIYTALIARIERITPRSILRTVRGMPEPGTVDTGGEPGRGA